MDALQIIAHDAQEWKGRCLRAEVDRDAWKTRAEKAETRAYDAEAHADLFRKELVAAESRATLAEAQAAAMRDVIQKQRVDIVAVKQRRLEAEAVISDAGRTLLAELEALRALEQTVRDARIAEWHAKADAEVDASYVRCLEALAAVDAARKGE